VVLQCPGINPVCVDLSDWTSTQKAVEAILPIELLVNNAAVAPASLGSFFETTESDFDE